MEKLELHELTPSKNWPVGRMPEWVDERTRLYSGFKVSVATKDWTQVLAVFDGESTTAYLTANGFDLEGHGPAIESISGKTEQYRKTVRKWFAESYGVEVSFS